MPLFRRHAHSKEILTPHFPDSDPNPKTNHLRPHSVLLSNYATPDSLDDALSLSGTPPPPPPHLVPTKVFPNGSYSPRHEPVSRKSAWGRTIRTETLGEDPFESDAFAVEMPTTREPVLGGRAETSRAQVSACRVKIPNLSRARILEPSRAQVEAYRTYEEKARLVRARNDSEGVRVPSKIVSYDYTYAREIGQAAAVPLRGDVSSVASSPRLSPAGSFPTSPTVAQHTWETRAAAQVQRNRLFSSSSDSQESYSCSISESFKAPAITRKPVGLGNTTRSRYQRNDSVTGASISSPLSPPKIKVRLVPRTTASQPQSTSPSKQRPPPSTPFTPSSSPKSSRSTSPGKHSPHFSYTTSASEQFKATKATAFAHTTKASGPNPKRTFAEILKDREKRKSEQKRTLATRWAWLRPAGPRIAKLVSTPAPAVATKPTPTAAVTPVATATATSYTDPFARHATPPHNTLPAARPFFPPSPKKQKLTRSIPAPPPTSPKRKFETGFAQITRFFGLVIRFLLVLYALVAVYFVLDAVREAVHTVGAPFRAAKSVGGYLGVVMGWAWKWLLRGWESWGIKIALRRG